MGTSAVMARGVPGYVPLARTESRWVRAGGLRLHARVTVGSPPDAPAVVLVHGLVVSSRYMVPLAEHLGPYYRVFAPDLPGFGRSQHPSRVMDLPALANALARWMEAAGLPRASLIANSYGCQTAAEFGVRHPERVEKIVLQGPTTAPGTRNTLEQFIRWRINAAKEPPGMSGIMRRDYADAGLRRAWVQFRHMIEDRIEDKLPYIEAETLVVRGSRDVVVTQRWAEEATRLLPRGRLVVIPGGVHTVNFYEPLELTRVVRPFLGDGSRALRPAGARLSAP